MIDEVDFKRQLAVFSLIVKKEFTESDYWQCACIAYPKLHLMYPLGTQDPHVSMCLLNFFATAFQMGIVEFRQFKTYAVTRKGWSYLVGYSWNN